MTAINECKVGFGVTFTVATIALTAIAAIAIGVIFAPPFFATALLAGSATYVAIGCGAGALITCISALFLLLNKGNDTEPYTWEDMAGPYQTADQNPKYLHYIDAIGHQLSYIEVRDFQKLFNDACQNDQIARLEIDKIVDNMTLSLNKIPFSSQVFIADYKNIKTSLLALLN